jgi:diaminopimelate decarboxylase
MLRDDIHDLIARCFGPQGGRLHVSDVSIAGLAEQYGTPLFVYDPATMDDRLNVLRRALPAKFDVYYSVKANPNLAILSHFVMRGCGLEVASGGEFIQAIAAGCRPDRILFAGPAKTDAELELTVSRNIGEIHVESPHEATRIAKICARRNVRTRVGIRVNPSGDVQGGAMRMGGKPAPFGVDEEKIDELVKRLSTERYLDLCGLHMFLGTQILDSSILVRQYQKAVDLARRVVLQTGRPLETVDFGGGLGIPYFPGDRELNLSEFAYGLSNLFNSVQHDPAFLGTRFVVEPGRFLVGEAGIYVARIIDIKESRGKKFLILDGGMNHHLAASGNLGQTIKRNYPMVLIDKLDCPAEEPVEVVGPLCTPLDTLGRSVMLPKADIGDLIAILQSGAYVRTASPLGFLSHPSPPEVWINQGQDFLIRSRGDVAEAMRGVNLPPAILSGQSCSRTLRGLFLASSNEPTQTERELPMRAES